jgi:hypothetical protein
MQMGLNVNVQLKRAIQKIPSFSTRPEILAR